MTFWILTGLILVTVAAAILLSARTARAATEAPADYDLRVYRDQLKEVERDLARGVLSEADAERVRVEVSRRILAADAAREQGQSRTHVGGGSLTALAAACIAVAGLTYFTYLAIGAPGYGDLALADRIEMAEQLRETRPDQTTAETSAGDFPPLETPTEEYLSLVQQLRGMVAERPDDLQGHRLLAQSEARLGNFRAAHMAQARVIELTGGPEAAMQDWTDYADLLVLAAGGYVSPEAERVLGVILQREPQNPIGRYYWGLMMRQTGRPDVAFRLWDTLLREGPPDAPWLPPITAQIGEVAVLAGVANYTPPTPAQQRGPSAADIEAAEGMSVEDRMSMIEGMVGGLAERLGSEGGPPEDWAQLISALGVLGRMAEAEAIYVNAQEVFLGAPSALDIINRAADRVGLR